MPFEVYIFGHSFIRRLNLFIAYVPALQNLGLDHTVFNIDCYGISGLKLTQRVRLHSKEECMVGKDLVVLDIGSNDLCDSICHPEQFALDLVSFSTYLVEGLSVKTVAISQILWRSIEPFPGYNDKVVQTNIAIQDVLRTSDYPIIFWKHRGMWNPPQDIFINDGVHLSNVIGYPKYVRSLRDCIIGIKNWN